MLKTTTKVLCILTTLCLWTANALAVKGEPWLTDMEQAQKIAKQENKHILILFTGSDWCAPCKILDERILEKEQFLAYAKDNLVLVELDFPKSENLELLTDAQKEHNQQWKKRFSVRAYPTIFMTDASATRYAKTGMLMAKTGHPLSTTPAQYIEHLEQLKADRQERKGIFAKADKVSGLERARLLDRAFGHERSFIENSDELINEIIALSTADQSLNNRYIQIKGDRDLDREMRAKVKRKNPPEENLKTMLSLLDQYDYLKEGEALMGLIRKITRAYIDVEQKQTALALLDQMVADNSYSQPIREYARVMKERHQ